MLARRGHRPAIDRLRNPHPYPFELRYLHEWLLELHARSGFSETGVNPLTWSTVHAWASHTRRSPDPAELQSLFALDAVLLFPKEEPTRG